MKSDTAIFGVILFIVVACVVIIAALYFEGYDEGVRIANTPPKNITVAHTYPRSDGYLNHYDPYVVTTDHRIYYVVYDKEWAKLEVGTTCSVVIADPKGSCNGRMCDGIIYSANC